MKKFVLMLSCIIAFQPRSRCFVYVTSLPKIATRRENPSNPIVQCQERKNPLSITRGFASENNGDTLI